MIKLLDKKSITIDTELVPKNVFRKDCYLTRDTSKTSVRAVTIQFGFWWFKKIKRYGVFNGLEDWHDLDTLKQAPFELCQKINTLVSKRTEKEIRKERIERESKELRERKESIKSVFESAELL